MKLNDHLARAPFNHLRSFVFACIAGIVGFCSPSAIAAQQDAASRYSKAIRVGFGPTSVVFDGTSVWCVNQESDNVTKILASNGTVQGTFNVGNTPLDAVFDGLSIWVPNWADDTVSQLRASDGALLGTFF